MAGDLAESMATIQRAAAVLTQSDSLRVTVEIGKDQNGSSGLALKQCCWALSCLHLPAGVHVQRDPRWHVTGHVVSKNS